MIENVVIKNLLIIILNYKRILKNIFYFLFYITLIICSGLLITLPIWYIATRFTKIYTVIVLLTILILITLVLIGNFKKWIILKQKPGNTTLKILMVPLKKIGIFILFSLGIYGIIISFSMGFLIFSIVITLCYFLFLGYYIFISKKKYESE